MVELKCSVWLGPFFCLEVRRRKRGAGSGLKERSLWQKSVAGEKEGSVGEAVHKLQRTGGGPSTSIYEP